MSDKFIVGDVWVTRDGRRVRILATDRRGRWPIIAMFTTGVLKRYSESGQASVSGSDSDLDLIARYTSSTPLWEGEVYISKEGNVHEVKGTYCYADWIREGWRKVRVREVSDDFEK